jgi:hypothetical protein
MPKHQFRLAIEGDDDAAIEPLMAPDVVLHSPVLHGPFLGREVVTQLLSVLQRTFTDVVYTDEFVADQKSALVYRAKLGALEAEGVQILRQGPDGSIVDITVLMRPLRVGLALAEALGPAVEKLPDGSYRIKPLEGGAEAALGRSA